MCKTCAAVSAQAVSAVKLEASVVLLSPLRGGMCQIAPGVYVLTDGCQPQYLLALVYPIHTSLQQLLRLSPHPQMCRQASFFRSTQDYMYICLYPIVQQLVLGVIKTCPILLWPRSLISSAMQCNAAHCQQFACKVCPLNGHASM